MIKKMYLFSVKLFFFNILFLSSLQAIDIYTEELPPYNFTKDGKIDGLATEIVKKVLEIAEIKYEIFSYPWARSYNMALEKKESLIYVIGRNKPREALFKWIGVLVTSEQSIYALKSQNVKINQLIDIKNFKIGTTINDFRESYLLSKGFKTKDFIRTGGKNPHIINYSKLKEKLIDLWPMPNTLAKYISRTQGDDPNVILEEVYSLEDISKNGYYLAASLATDDATVKKLKKALNSFKQSSDYEEILKRWDVK